jgi:hypothetical protein
VTDDPERDWAIWRPAEKFWTSIYRQMMQATPDDYGQAWGYDDSSSDTSPPPTDRHLDVRAATRRGCRDAAGPA